MIKMLYDVDLMRPGCVLLQAACSGDQHALTRMFPPETWLVSPTPGLMMRAATEEQWQMVAEHTMKHAEPATDG